jgi:transcriptional regulator GlxA family with amidase domain
VFRSAGKTGIDVTARLVTQEPEDIVVGAYGLLLLSDAVCRPGQADALVVAGGGWATRAEAGAWAEVQRGDWMPLLREAARAARIIVGACTGTMLLAHAGVIGSRRAGTHHAARDDLASTGATVIRDRVVDDGDLVTSGGVTSGIDLALWIVEREFGRDAADRISQREEYPRFRPVVERARGFSSGRESGR